MDIHEPTATVRESLRFSALLRQPKEVPLQEKYDYCETVIDLLEMRSIAGATVGTAGSGLNQEQRKRLTIAVELASKPELLLFLDEPTSGLDSLAAFNIVRFLRRLADAGQAVLCTIHQPSAVLFENFDDLLLLKTGGRVVYNGPLGNDSKTLIDYFERNGGKKCSPHANPAEVCILKVLSSIHTDHLLSTCWKLSELETPITRDKTGAMSGRTRKSLSSCPMTSRALSPRVAMLKETRRPTTTASTQCLYSRRSLQ
jgi:ATP-binding cassette subfamily G (WHITE) protein 2 (SNQ2)